MKKIKLLIILLIPLLFITGCGSTNSKLDKAVSKTSITKKGLKSYRCKVSVVNKDSDISYVVLNDSNKNYDISVTTKDKSYSYKVEDGEIVASPSVIVNINKDDDYTDTDKFLNGLENATDIKESTYKIDDTEYKKYEFKISKVSMNKMLSSFGIKVKKDGKGTAYIDKDNHVYIVNYVSGNVSLGVSYTRYNNVK